MALRPEHSVCVICGQMVLVDRTRPYNQENNPNGYGSPNPDFGEVTPYTASFILPGAKQAALVLDMNADPPQPDADGDYVWKLSPSQFGMPPGQRLLSGTWRIIVQFGSQSMRLGVLVLDDIEARVSSCICRNPENVALWAQLQAAKMMYCCHKEDMAQKMIARLYKETECCKCSDTTPY